jgi:hypothetical protein
MRLSASQKTDPMLFDLRALFLASFAWVILHETVPYSVILFWRKMVRPPFVSYHDTVKKVVALDSISFQQL